MKRGTPQHPKTYELAARLGGVPLYHAVGLLEMLWHFTARYAPAGDIGKHSDAVIAKNLDWEKNPSIIIELLCECGWIDTHPKYRYVIHDWHDHAEQLTSRYLGDHGLAFATNGIVPTPSPKKQGKTSSELVKTSAALVFPSQPEPEPEPEPVPEPVPEPLLPKVSALVEAVSVSENGARAYFSKAALSGTFDRLYPKHPKQKDRKTALANLAIAAKIRPLDEIERCHDAWCKSQEWTKEGGKYAPKLGQWLEDQGFTKWPAETTAKPTIRIYETPTLEKRRTSQNANTKVPK